MRGLAPGAAMLAVAIVAGVALAPSGALAGGTTDISVTDNAFTPADATDLSFRWQWDPAGDGVTINPHSVHQEDGFFDSGNPVTSREDYEILLPAAGTYPYFCEFHGSAMSGTVRKYVFRGADDPGQSRVAIWSTGGNFVYDVQYRVNGGEWRKWKTDTEKRKGNFGANNKPVNVNKAKTYEVRARSLKPSRARKTGYSPPLGLFDVR